LGESEQALAREPGLRDLQGGFTGRCGLVQIFAKRRRNRHIGLSSQGSTSEATIDPEDKAGVNSFTEMLSFYGLQLQSHASVMIALALLGFAVIQAWGALPSDFKSAPYHSILFSLIVGIMGLGIVFELLRLYVYGQLASAIMYASTANFNEAKSRYVELHKKEIPDIWDRILDLTKVNIYTQWWFERNAKFWVSLKVIDVGLHVRAWVLGAAFEISVLASYGLIFGSPDLYGLGQLGVWSTPPVVALLIGRSTLKRLRKRSKETSEKGV